LWHFKKHGVGHVEIIDYILLQIPQHGVVATT
jgi:hypothetical protein